jgi:hypothetical protein
MRRFLDGRWVGFGLFAALAAWALCKSPRAAAEEPAAGTLSPVEYEAIRDELDLKNQPWATVPWHVNVTEARRSAGREQKPIFLVVNTGNCLGFV